MMGGDVMRVPSCAFICGPPSLQMKAHDGTRITSPPIIVTFQKLFRPLSLALATSAKSGWRDQDMVVASFAKHLLGISARRFAFETRFTDLSETSALICRKIRSHIGPIRIQKVAVITDGVPR